MGFNCGIVRLPNVGKSALFNARTKSGIAAENFPFCTIEPNSGIVPMPDPRLDALAAIAKPERVIPTTMAFVDIAGLVAGASKGEGLGNQFPANIRSEERSGGKEGVSTFKTRGWPSLQQQTLPQHNSTRP